MAPGRNGARRCIVIRALPGRRVEWVRFPSPQLGDAVTWEPNSGVKQRILLEPNLDSVSMVKKDESLPDPIGSGLCKLVCIL